MAAIPTVKIRSEDTESGYVIINESDFDREVHKPYAEAQGRAYEAKHRGGGKWAAYVDGKPLRDGDEAGDDYLFDSKALAEAALAEYAAAQAGEP